MPTLAKENLSISEFHTVHVPVDVTALAGASASAAKGLTHWGRVTHICVGKLTIIGSDNGLSPARRQAII